MKLDIHVVVPLVNSATGSVRRLVALAAGLKDRGHDVTLIASAARSSLCELAKQQGVRLCCGERPVRRKKTMAHKLIRVLNLISGSGEEVKGYRAALVGLPRPDVVIARNALGVLGVSGVYRDIPLVWDVGIETRKKFGGILFRAAALRSAAIVAQTTVIAGELGVSVPKTARSSIHVIPPGMKLPLSVRCTNPFWLPDGQVVLQVGSIHSRKNQITAIRAFARARSKAIDDLKGCVLVFAGAIEDAEYKRFLDREVMRLGIHHAVSFVGWRDDVRDAIANVDFILLPSFDEGVSNVLQEAMLSGVPVIASTAGGNSEIVTDRWTGRLHVADDVDGLADILVDAFDEPYRMREDAQRARAFAIENFSVETWVNRYERVLLGVVDF